MRVVGTAGHVDHGKSTLVRALTGIDPDRLKEEKSRGMTIDLGFAWFDLSLRPHDTTEAIGVVDVPGHIDFIKNMLAGVGGIDAAILVIAADEGVMPQTREHLDILDLLAVPSTIVALTKTDLVDEEEWLDLVELDIVELMQTTRFADAGIVRVSPISGQGMDELRNTLGVALSHLPVRRNRERPRLPIDRVFSLSGFGTVVTGTLSDGRLRVGEEVEILPAGLKARVRGLQTHKQAVQAGEPGSRLAINLSGVGTEDVNRGDVVVRPGTLQPTNLVDVSFRLLPGTQRSLRHNMDVSFHTGASETPAKVRLLGAEELTPGSEGWLQLRLARPVVAAPGDRYILRQPSPSQTLGGGSVVDANPQRRWRRYNDEVLRRLHTLSKGVPDEIVLDALSGRPFQDVDELVAASGLDVEDARAAIAELQGSGAVVTLPTSPKPLLLTATQRDEAIRTLGALVADFHDAYPLRAGMVKGELRSKLLEVGGPAADVKVFSALVEYAESIGALESVNDSVRVPGFEVRLTGEQSERVERFLDMLGQAGVSSPSQSELLTTLGGDTRLLEMLIDQGRALRVGDGILYRREDFDRMTERVKAYIVENGSITLAETRDLFGTSRRYAQAILEELDARGVTRRRGDERVLRPGN